MKPSHRALEAQVTELREALDGLTARAATEPLETDVSDYGDEWCAGFLAGQVNALEALDRAVPASEEGDKQ